MKKMDSQILNDLMTIEADFIIDRHLANFREKDASPATTTTTTTTTISPTTSSLPFASDTSISPLHTANAKSKWHQLFL